jgi:hypothetical protein
MALLGVGWGELAPARRAVSPAVHVPAAVGLERRRTVRAHDPEVLEPIVVANPVDVIEDQRQPPSLPEFALPAQLTTPRLDAFRVQALLELPTRERRSCDEDLV